MWVLLFLFAEVGTVFVEVVAKAFVDFHGPLADLADDGTLISHEYSGGHDEIVSTRIAGGTAAHVLVTYWETWAGRPCHERGKTRAGSPCYRIGSEDVRLAGGLAGVEEFEVAALVGLGAFVGEEQAVAALEALLRGFPRFAAFRQLLVADVEMKLSRDDVERDEVAVVDEGEGAAEGGFGGDV